MDNNSTITPSQYFDYVKGAKNTITTDALKKSYGVFISLAEKYNKVGQTESLKKLSFLVDTLIKEEKLIGMGLTTYVYKDVIEDYIMNVADNTVKIIELSRYMREIPDELVDSIEKTKDIFDEFYVVYTDYTGKEERKVEKERREKDPILFGVFKNSVNISDRFYFIGDWVDEYCDLTLDKMIDEYTEKKGYSPANEVEIPESSDELVEILKKYVPSKSGSKGFVRLMEQDSSMASDDVSVSVSGLDMPVDVYVKTNQNVAPKGGFLQRIRSVFSKKG